MGLTSQSYVGSTNHDAFFGSLIIRGDRPPRSWPSIQGVRMSVAVAGPMDTTHARARRLHFGGATSGGALAPGLLLAGLI
jgi:hypothetical protein